MMIGRRVITALFTSEPMATLAVPVLHAIQCTDIMIAKLLLPHAMYRAMLAHARAQYPNEACGLLRGKHGRVTGFLPAKNVSPTPRTDFEVDAESLLRALRWEDEGSELIAIFHSHPTSPAYPSLVDAARAFYPDSVYLILSLLQPDDPQLKGYFLRPEAIFKDNQAEILRRDIPFQQVRPDVWGYHLDPAIDLEALPSLTTAKGADFYLVYDHPLGPIRLIHIQPVDILLQL